MALTYEFEVAAKGSASHLRTEPAKRITNTQQSIPVAQLEQNEQNKKQFGQGVLNCLPPLVEDNENVKNGVEQMDVSIDSKNDSDDDDEEEEEEEDNDGDDNDDDDNDDDGGWCVIKRKNKRNHQPDTVTPDNDDTISVTSSVARRQALHPGNALPGFYYPPDENQQVSIV